VRNRTGLHARPASDFVKAAKSFNCEINIYRAGEADEKVNAKSIVMLLSLGLGRGETVGIAAEGEDAPAAVDALTGLIESGFGEI